MTEAVACPDRSPHVSYPGPAPRGKCFRASKRSELAPESTPPPRKAAAGHPMAARGTGGSGRQTALRGSAEDQPIAADTRRRGPRETRRLIQKQALHRKEGANAAVSAPAKRRKPAPAWVN